jgi:hypothetical protein
MRVEEKMDKSVSIVSTGDIEQKIYMIRGDKVILDFDLIYKKHIRCD